MCGGAAAGDRIDQPLVPAVPDRRPRCGHPRAGRKGRVRTSVGYDIDPLDYTDPGAALVESRVRAQLHGGAIVSLHTLYTGTATAFSPIVASIRAQGLEPVTTSAVLGR